MTKRRVLVGTHYHERGDNTRFVLVTSSTADKSELLPTIMEYLEFKDCFNRGLRIRLQDTEMTKQEYTHLLFDGTDLLWPGPEATDMFGDESDMIACHWNPGTFGQVDPEDIEEQGMDWHDWEKEDRIRVYGIEGI